MLRVGLTHHERSPRGLRLTMVGIGLFFLGLTVGVALGAVIQGVWLVGLVVALGSGSLSAVFFRWATRVGESKGNDVSGRNDRSRGPS